MDPARPIVVGNAPHLGRIGNEKKGILDCHKSRRPDYVKASCRFTAMESAGASGPPALLPRQGGRHLHKAVYETPSRISSGKSFLRQLDVPASLSTDSSNPTAACCALRQHAAIVRRMGKVRLSQRPAGVRLMASLLLAGFLLLTAAPICGGPSDVDSGACCQRHRCGQSGLGSKVVNGVSRERRQVCRSCDKRSYSGRSSAEDCCRRGDLAYPVAEAQPHASVSVLTLIPIVALCQASRSLPSTGSVSVQTADTSPPLKIPLIALYTLHSAYRI